jgi:hypothetical protein
MRAKVNGLTASRAGDPLFIRPVPKMHIPAMPKFGIKRMGGR